MEVQPHREIDAITQRKPIPNEDLFVQYAESRDVHIRNRLIEKYVSLVRYLARQICLPKQQVEIDDLISEGIFGLIQAIESFDLSRKFQFETYCVPRVRGAMIDAMHKMNCTPKLIQQSRSKLRNAESSLHQALGRQSTDEELATYMEISEEELNSIRKKMVWLNMKSLQTKVYETDSGKDLKVIDIYPDKKAKDGGASQNNMDFWRNACRGLKKQERIAVLLYYIDGFSMKEIGQELGCTQSNVTLILQSAHRYLEARLVHESFRNNIS
ncbi:MAG: sigma-70 family RNA polymerase sigma factor [Candidatus Peregrinibacteria bacterium]|nr:sigma-70 family RNA polymerase sigma factor [Candidatus Peregrinibacteria bacterium]